MPEKTRHCMIVHAHYPHDETRVERQARALVAEGFDVDVLCLREVGEPATALVDGVRVYRLPVRRRRAGITAQLAEYLAFFVLALGAVAWLHRRRHYAVVQVHNLPDFLVFAGVVPRLRGARLILDLHDLMPEFFASRVGTAARARLATRLLRLQERWSCRFADHVVTVTDSWRQVLVDRGVPTHKTSVVMNVPDTAIFTRRSARSATRGANDGPHLLYHGTLAYRYGIDLVVRAVHRLSPEMPGLRMTIHGNGEYQSDLRSLVDHLDVADRVGFSSGYLPTVELARMIGEADLAVVPYRRDVFTDGILPTKLLEYVASGVPLVCTRTPAIEAHFAPEMVSFVESEDLDGLAAAIRGHQRDPGVHQVMADRAYTVIERHDWSRRAAAEYVDLVTTVGRRGHFGRSR